MNIAHPVVHRVRPKRSELVVVAVHLCEHQIVPVYHVRLNLRNLLFQLTNPLLKRDVSLRDNNLLFRKRIVVLQQNPVPRFVVDKPRAALRVVNALLDIARRSIIIPCLEVEKCLKILYAIGALLLQKVHAVDCANIKRLEFIHDHILARPLGDDARDEERKFVVKGHTSSHCCLIVILSIAYIHFNFFINSYKTTIYIPAFSPLLYPDFRILCACPHLRRMRMRAPPCIRGQSLRPAAP